MGKFANYKRCCSSTTSTTSLTFPDDFTVTLYKSTPNIASNSNGNQILSSPLANSGALSTTCFVKDSGARVTNTAIDIANRESAIKDPFSSLKEFIFNGTARNVFSDYKFIQMATATEVHLFQIVAEIKISTSESLNGTRYTATQSSPFVSIVAGLIKTTNV